VKAAPVIIVLLLAGCPAPAPPPKILKPDAGQAVKNRLGAQSSLYLRQHAKNPVHWQPWDDRALARAMRLDLPIFLSIGYASCHWCHVMEHEVFEDREVARALNQGFVSIKVDREERPDLDAVYMTAVQAMTGGGGWPLSVFLTPDLKPFFGGTYFPRPRFLALLGKVRTAYKERRGDLQKTAARLHQVIARDRATAGGTLPGQEATAAAYAQALKQVDQVWGGEQGRMKFPMPSRWAAMLGRYRRTGDRALARAVGLTLDQMASGGMRDHLAGGFHRYTTEPTWLVPHFEKMLYDNAQLASLYLDASTTLGVKEYAAVARQTLDFMLAEMTSPQGGHYASFDADSGGEEGTFYIWTQAELEAVAGPADGEALARLLGVTSKGNFEGKSILTRRVSGDDALLRRWRPALLKHRAARPRPTLDRKVITSWNGLAIRAMARGYALLGEPSYLAAARRAADFLWRQHRKEGTLLRSSTDGRAREVGVLDDHAFLASGLLALHQADGDPAHLTRARELVEAVRKRFAHKLACYYLTPAGHEAPMGRQIPISDGARPSGNAVLLRVMLALSALTGEQRYRQEVSACLASQASIMTRAGLGMARWWQALEQLRGPFYEVIIAGDAASADTAALLAAYWRLDPGYAVLIRIPSAGPSARSLKLLPATEEKRALAGKATAYVCQHGSCKAPTSDPATLRRQLLEGWRR